MMKSQPAGVNHQRKTRSSGIAGGGKDPDDRSCGREQDVFCPTLLKASCFGGDGADKRSFLSCDSDPHHPWLSERADRYSQ
ncbi:uncharacterized [Tachysurus ichikawai]